jgi:hypothetical protein
MRLISSVNSADKDTTTLNVFDNPFMNEAYSWIHVDPTLDKKKVYAYPVGSQITAG